MTVIELKAKAYDLLAQRSMLDQQLVKVNQDLSNACKKCNAFPCECKPKGENGKS
mgnify:CR=1 FL=1